MAVTAFWYASAILEAFKGTIDIVNDDPTVALTTSSYSPNQDTHNFFNDVTNELSTANGYTAGGLTLDTPTGALTNNIWKFDSVDPEWTTGAGETLTAARAVYYVVKGGCPDADPLLSWVNFGTDESASNTGTFTIVQHANGIARVTATDATGQP